MTQTESFQPNVFGLTGGMGSGKSTVSEVFAEKGAVILDADQIVRDLQEPGQPGLMGMVEILGEEIMADNGSLDRKAAARQIFADSAKRQAVEAFLHPLVWSEINKGIEQADGDTPVILDVPLLFETKQHDLPKTIVVDTPVELAVANLVTNRGYTEDEALARINQQMSRKERLRRASFVIPNYDSLEHFHTRIEFAWAWIKRVQQTGKLALVETVEQGAHHE